MLARLDDCRRQGQKRQRLSFMAMESRGRDLVLACVLASLLVPALASASTVPYTETRVRGLDLGNPYSVRASGSLTLGAHQGYGLGYDDLASGFPLAARAGTRLADDAVDASRSGRRAFVGDARGNNIPVEPGEFVTGSPDGRWIQVRGPDGVETGLRLDGPHNPLRHPDPRAQAPHAHVPGVANPDGTPWLPVY